MGQVAWARLDDVRSHFGYSGLPAQADPNDFSYICADGHLQPLTVKNPCVWVAKPWPAIAARRSSSEKVQLLLEKLSHEVENSWENAMLSLLETYHVNVTALDYAIPIDDYLDQAVGFQGAYSFPPCNPSRSIVYCTTSLIQHAKCSWLQEVAGVYGVEPNLQCIRAESLDRCMDDTKHNFADVVLVDQDDRLRAERDFHLKPILYEYSTKLEDRYAIVAIVRSKTNFKGIKDLRGRKACFPYYEGAAYLSVTNTLRNMSLIPDDCHKSQEISNFFAASSCTWESRRTSCDKSYRGDEGALKCLAEGGGDVAFVSMDVWKNFTDGHIVQGWSRKLSEEKIKLLCPYGENRTGKDPCYLHWAPRGHLMIHNETSLMRRNEIYNSLRDMDRLFGKQYKSQSAPFTLFGPFDKRSNVMFRDVTDGLRGITELVKDKIPRNLEDTYLHFVHKKCQIAATGASSQPIVSFMSVVVSILSTVILFNRNL